VLPIAGTAREGIEAAKQHRPDIVLVDIGLPDQSGLHVGARILQELPETKVVALTAIEDSRLAREAIKAGFQGYLTKNADMHQFLSSLRSVLAGSAVISQQVAGGRDRSHADLAIEQLTDRERQVLGYLARGYPGTAIAEELGIAKNTVRTHVQSILSKLQVHSRLEAAAFAVRHGVVRPRSGPHGDGIVHSA
jgi:two-component system nitrate/nitrite response regulator NarL